MATAVFEGADMIMLSVENAAALAKPSHRPVVVDLIFSARRHKATFTANAAKGPSVFSETRDWAAFSARSAAMWSVST